MARCVLSTSLDHVYLQRVEIEAEKRGLSVSALAREVLMAAFPSSLKEKSVVEADVANTLVSERKRMIFKWWVSIPVQDRPSYFCMDDVVLNVFKTGTVSHGDQVSIGRALKQLGFAKDRLMTAGVRRWAYRPREFLKHVVQKNESDS